MALAPRIALERVVLRGHVIEPGQTIQLSFAAANRDPARFSEFERFDIARRQGGALGFGHGPHSCVGAGLGRMQTATALEALMRRAPDPELDPNSEVVWCALAGVQAPEALSVRPRAAPAARRAR